MIKALNLMSIALIFSMLAGCGSSAALNKRVDDLTAEVERTQIKKRTLKEKIAELEGEIERLQSENKELKERLTAARAESDVLKLESSQDLLKIKLGVKSAIITPAAKSEADVFREKLLKEREQRLRSDIQKEIEKLEQKVKGVKEPEKEEKEEKKE